METIRQNGKIILHSNDGTSIMSTRNNPECMKAENPMKLWLHRICKSYNYNTFSTKGILVD